MLEVLLSIVEHALPGCVVQVKEVLHFEAAATFVARLAQVVLREAAHNPLLRDTVGATAHKYNISNYIYVYTAHCALLTAQCAALLSWLSKLSGFLVVFEKPSSRSSLTFTFPAPYPCGCVIIIL